MKMTMLKCISATCVFCCCLSASAQRGRGLAKLNQLLTDVENAMPNASLSIDQKTKLQGDLDSIKKQLNDAQEGDHPDRDKILSAINDMHTIVDSGAFKNEDQTALDKEFKSVTRH